MNLPRDSQLGKDKQQSPREHTPAIIRRKEITKGQFLDRKEVYWERLMIQKGWGK
jgi:hypothetical protein